MEKEIGWYGGAEMSDIVERLRLRVTKGHEPTDEDAIDALAEIEQLRAEIDQQAKVYWEQVAKIERLREGHEKIIAWANAYPLANFPEPDFKKCEELLGVGGILLDSVSASAMRHVITEVAKISRLVLDG